jgi:hypothetical protein
MSFSLLIGEVYNLNGKKKKKKEMIKNDSFSLSLSIQVKSEYQTSLVFEWFKSISMANGLVFKCHSKI